MSGRTGSVLLVVLTAACLSAQTISVTPQSVKIIGCIPGSESVEQLTVTSSSGEVAFTIEPEPGEDWVQVDAPDNVATVAGTTIFFKVSAAWRGERKSYFRIIPANGTAPRTVKVSAECFPLESFYLQTDSVTVDVPVGTTMALNPILLRRRDGGTAGGLTFTLRPHSAPWIADASAAPMQASSTSSQLNVVVDASGLQQGRQPAGYLDVIANESRDSLEIILNVTAPPLAKLVASTQTVNLSAVAGAAASNSRTVQITSNTGEALEIEVGPTTDNQVPWLRVNGSTARRSMNTPADLVISASTANLVPGVYDGTVTIAAPGDTERINVQLTVESSAPPIRVSSVVNGASFEQNLAPGAFATIFGTQLAPDTTGPAGLKWDASFVSNALPLEVGGVRVTVDGRPAPVAFIRNDQPDAAAQINFLVPAETPYGSVAVVVRNSLGESETYYATVQQYAPAFFVIPGTRGLIVAVYTDGAYAGRENLLPGARWRPARAGDILQIFGTGFGPTDPPLTTSTVINPPRRMTTPVSVLIGSRQAQVQAAYLVYAGVYQLNVVVPDGLAAGDQPIRATVGGVPTQTPAYITVQ